MRAAVVGLGKIGVPLAVQYASRGLDVTGYDVDEEKVNAINAGCCPIAGEEGLDRTKSLDQSGFVSHRRRSHRILRKRGQP